MERLTSWNEDCVQINGHALGYASIGELVQMAERLAAYEDTGLTPEEIKDSFTPTTVTIMAGQALGVHPCRIRELAEADKDGRVVILPCKVGDIVWFTRSTFRQVAEPIEAVVLCAANHGGAGLTYTTRTVNGGLQRKFTSGQIGKTVFLTREEAERAMEGKKDD